MPDAVATKRRGEPVTEADRTALRCPHCGGWLRPHVLWFDESYDEPRFHLDTVRRIAMQAALVIVAGTSAQTNLPWQVVTLGARAGATIVDINVEDNPFGEIAERSGGVVRGFKATGEFPRKRFDELTEGRFSGVGMSVTEVKRGLRDSYRRLLDLEFDGVLFAHGDPIPSGGKEAIREFVR